MNHDFVEALRDTGYPLRIIDEEGDEYNYSEPDADFLNMAGDLDMFTLALISPTTGEVIGSFLFVEGELNDNTLEPLTESLSRHA